MTRCSQCHSIQLCVEINLVLKNGDFNRSFLSKMEVAVAVTLRRSSRITGRMGKTSDVPLVGPLTTPSGRLRMIQLNPLEYSGRPHGRPRGSGRGTQYMPTGRNLSRPRGSMNRPHGFSC